MLQSPSNSEPTMEPSYQPGIISLTYNNIKQTINFYPVEGTKTPQIGDTVEFNMYLVKSTKEHVAKDIKIYPTTLTSVTPSAIASGRQSLVGSGRTFVDRSGQLQQHQQQEVTTANSNNLSNGIDLSPWRRGKSSSNSMDYMGLFERLNSTRQEDNLFTSSFESVSKTEMRKELPVSDFTKDQQSTNQTTTLQPSSQVLPKLNQTLKTPDSFISQQSDNKISQNLNVDVCDGMNSSLSLQTSNASSPKPSSGSGISNSVKISTSVRTTPVHQGFIATLKDSFGFIETLNHDKEIFFHFRYGIDLVTVQNYAIMIVYVVTINFPMFYFRNIVYGYRNF